VGQADNLRRVGNRRRFCLQDRQAQDATRSPLTVGFG